MFWKGTVNNMYYMQSRNSMRGMRINDRRCEQDARKFLSGVYKCVGHDPPVWKSVPTRDCREQKRGSNTCALHVAANGYLIRQGLQFTHTFDEQFVESLRMYILYTISVLHT